ncbi:glutathione S-transferase family protein [Methylobacterium sp. J-076]|uniref:glutathione S-transferase family protein n=1 Tax=Methylobacterium sp. J-076 TaxID=2836655 RepID=UPI001FB8A056|nr:glutathione S-transferase family protein [Methylobacterium sp. J-076]MCJ2013447.1 glutathione S-transferase family protein [Methylobacterium sp. J-076]
MRRLWGRLTSVNVQKAVWALDEADLPYERIDAGGSHGIVREPAYRAMNPNALVPTLEEDGFVLWESNAIMRYVASVSPALAMPEDPRQRAHVEQWVDWQATSFTPAMRDAFWQLFRTAEPDRALVAASLAASQVYATILDAHLAGRGYAVGEGFTIADIALGCAAHRWLNLPAERPDLPNLRRWYDRIATRPAAARALGEPVG